MGLVTRVMISSLSGSQILLIRPSKSSYAYGDHCAPIPVTGWFNWAKSQVTCANKRDLLYMDTKTNYPDSDETARSKHPESDAGDDVLPNVDEETSGLQISNKSGKHSSVEKLAASRPEFGSGRGAKPVDGAFGRDEEGQRPTGRNASPGTNRYRCETCGRFFNTASELSEHAIECSTAKAATRASHQ